MNKNFRAILVIIVLGLGLGAAIYKFKDSCTGCSANSVISIPEPKPTAVTDTLEDAKSKFKTAEDLYLKARNSDESARDSLIAKAKTGDYGAKTYLAMLYLFGGKELFINKEQASELFAQAKSAIQKWADADVDQAQTALGLMYQYALGGLSKNEKEAINLYKLAVNQGHALGQNCLGWMYDNGAGTAKDLAKAFKYYKLSADQGHSTAQHNVGWMYEFERGVRQDMKEAVKYYKLSAGQGNASGQADLARKYRDGHGELPQDDKEAVRLFILACEQGNSAAQENLGKMYEEGRGGLPKDEKEAVKLYKLSAEQNNPNAQSYLGESYEKGIGGLPKDKNEAIRLYRLAANPKNEPFNKEALANLERLGVSAEEIS